MSTEPTPYAESDRPEGMIVVPFAVTQRQAEWLRWLWKHPRCNRLLRRFFWRQIDGSGGGE